jgi:hypothetical protein
MRQVNVWLRAALVSRREQFGSQTHTLRMDKPVAAGTESNKVVRVMIRLRAPLALAVNMMHLQTRFPMTEPTMAAVPFNDRLLDLTF